MQRPLPFGPALRVQQASELRGRLQPHVPGALHLTLTHNSAVMISVRRDATHRQYWVRAHQLFLAAPGPVIRALGRYIAYADPDASAELNEYIDQNDHQIASRSGRGDRSGALRTRGRVYDLVVLFDSLNARYFDGAVTARIGWGRHPARGRERRSVMLGGYYLDEHLIRIHPGLDQEWLPPFYLEWVVFHEMLHSLHPIPVVNGRRQYHTPAFEADERRFARYEEAQLWERQHLAALLQI
ncbi:MAG: hypothetical protein IT371_24330 [Deltaproteobacteria bacterium]|nr:hypothetical protein [Deltaproteobacteria bacterium]